MLSKFLNRLLGKKDIIAQLASLSFHYERHLYCADKFKDIMRGLHSVALPEVFNEHDAIIGGAYFCTREQLIAANGSRHCDWGPFPESVTGATFVVHSDCSVRVHFAQLYPVAPATPVKPAEFADTILGKGALAVLENCRTHSLPSLFSAARSEYLRTGVTGGHFMAKLTGLFRGIAEEAYAGDFVWSDYNLRQWRKFIASEASSDEGGSCVFSCEADGGYSGEIHDTFKGLFVGVPTGMHPYSVSVRHGIAKVDTDTIRASLVAQGFPAV